MPQESPQQIAWRKEFDKLGETGVRMMFGNGAAVVASDKEMFSRAWLKEREDSRCDAREDKTLRLAKWANIIAITAIIIAAIAAHKEIYWLISSAISWFSS